MQTVVAQTPQEAAANVAEQLVAKAIPQLEEIARVESEKLILEVPKKVEGPAASVTKAVNDELAASAAEVASERAREDNALKGVSQAIDAARVESVAKARDVAQQWARSLTDRRVMAAEEQDLKQSVETEAEVERLRKVALSELEVGSTAANFVSNLAAEAPGLKDELSKAHVEAVVQSFLDRNAQARGKATQSMRTISLSDRILKEAAASADAALKRAIEAEKGANEALATARRNTDRIAKLKIRAQSVYQKANGMA